MRRRNDQPASQPASQSVVRARQTKAEGARASPRPADFQGSRWRMVACPHSCVRRRPRKTLDLHCSCSALQEKVPVWHSATGRAKHGIFDVNSDLTFNASQRTDWSGGHLARWHWEASEISLSTISLYLSNVITCRSSGGLLPSVRPAALSPHLTGTETLVTAPPPPFHICVQQPTYLPTHPPTCRCLIIRLQHGMKKQKTFPRRSRFGQHPASRTVDQSASAAGAWGSLSLQCLTRLDEMSS